MFRLKGIFLFALAISILPTEKSWAPIVKREFIFDFLKSEKY